MAEAALQRAAVEEALGAAEATEAAMEDLVVAMALPEAVHEVASEVAVVDTPLIERQRRLWRHDVVTNTRQGMRHWQA